MCSRINSRIQFTSLNGLKEKLFEADGVRNCAGLNDDRRLTVYSGILSLPILSITKEQIPQPWRPPLARRLEERLRASRETTKLAPYSQVLLPIPDTESKRPSTLSLSGPRHTSTRHIHAPLTTMIFKARVRTQSAKAACSTSLAPRAWKKHFSVRTTAQSSKVVPRTLVLTKD